MPDLYAYVALGDMNIQLFSLVNMENNRIFPEKIWETIPAKT